MYNHSSAHLRLTEWKWSKKISRGTKQDMTSPSCIIANLKYCTKATAWWWICGKFHRNYRWKLFYFNYNSAKTLLWSCFSHPEWPSVLFTMSTYIPLKRFHIVPLSWTFMKSILDFPSTMTKKMIMSSLTEAQLYRKFKDSIERREHANASTVHGQKMCDLF